jgi:protoheme IX farnesyltransferase
MIGAGGNKHMIKAVPRLVKVWISALAGFSAATGYILARDGVSPGIVAPALGVFVLACGSCAMNQIQERRIDSLMLRTRQRPIPSGRIGVYPALMIALLLLGSGSLLLFLFSPLLTLGLATLAVAWYNGVYTYLKRRSMFAAVPGGLVGALPPAVGWTAAGGSLAQPEIISLMVFLFVWQVPHFWLLLLNHRKDYERAGLPSVFNLFSTRQMGRITFVWILAAAVSPMVIPMSGGNTPVVLLFILAAMAVWIGRGATRYVVSAGVGVPVRSLYITLNVYAVLVLSLLSAGGILGGKS